MPIDAQTTEKRFIIPVDSIGHERLKATQSVIQEVQAEYPEVLSLCAFGSSTTGKAKEASDIDGWLFVDVDQITERTGILASELVETEVRQTEWGGSLKRIHFNDEVQHRYDHLVRDRLQQRLGLSDEQLDHIVSKPISNEIVDELLNDLLNYDTDLQAYYKQRREITRSINEGNFDVDLMPAFMPDRPNFGILPIMFHLAIGRGIGPWRTMLVDRLSSLGDPGERIWNIIILDTETFENRLNANPNKSYPRTLDQARQAYGSSKT